MAAKFDDFEFDSESEDDIADIAGGRKVNDLKGMIEGGLSSDFAWTTEHVLLCHLISLYGKCATRAGEDEKWIRSMALGVLTYECISSGVLDFDYAPVLTDVSYKGSTRKIWLNTSQEAQTAIDELRIHGMVRVVRMYTVDYKPMTAYQVSLQGLKMMKNVPKALFDELKAVVYVPDKDNTYTDMVQISWEDEKELFALRSAKSGYLRYSTITEIEDVSYVCSPYIPHFLRRGQEPTTNNRGRAEEAFAGMTNIRDGDLMEAVVLGDVRLILAEWVPFGENSISAMSINLGALDRCRSGMFTAMVDKEPSATILNVPPGLTHVRVLDYDLLHHVNVEAEINYPEDDGIVQVEFFGIHVSTRGNVVFGLAVDSIMTRDKDAVSIDLLTRMAVDVVQDSSTILEDLMSQHQRELIDALHQGHANKRRKFAVYLAANIDPFFATSSQYLDRGDHENEIAQIIGQMRFAKDLSGNHFLFMGTIGVLLVGARAHQYDAFLVPYANLQAMMVSADTVFARFNHIFEMLDAAMDLVQHTDTTPFNVEQVQYLMSRSAQEINLLALVISHLMEAADRALMPPEPHDDVGIALFAALRCRQWQASVVARAVSLRALMDDAERKVGYLKRFATMVNKHGLYKQVVMTGVNTARMVLNVRSKFDSAIQYWKLQTLLAALFMVKLFDGYRWGSNYCTVLPLEREVVRVINRNDIVFSYADPPNRVFSDNCPWINPIQNMVGDMPFVFLGATVALALILTIFWDKMSYLIWKRSRKMFNSHINHWLGRFGDENMHGRISHRVDLDKLQVFIDEAALRAYVAGKQVVRECPRREILNHIDVEETHCLLHWREVGSKSAWGGLGVPEVTLCWDRGVGVLRSVKIDVFGRRVKGVHVSDLWPILRARLAAANVIQDPETRPQVIGVDNDNRVLRRVGDREEWAKPAVGKKDEDVDDCIGIKQSVQDKAAAIAQRKSGTAAVQRAGLTKQAVAEWRSENKTRITALRKGRAERRRESKQARTRVMKQLYDDDAPSILSRLFALFPSKKKEEEEEEEIDTSPEDVKLFEQQEAAFNGEVEQMDSDAGSEPGGPPGGKGRDDDDDE